MLVLTNGGNRLSLRVLRCHDQQGVQGRPPLPGKGLENLLLDGVQVPLQVTGGRGLVTHKGVNDLAHVKSMQPQLFQDSWKGVRSLCRQKSNTSLQ